MKAVLVALGLLIVATISTIPGASIAGPGDVIISSPEVALLE